MSSPLIHPLLRAGIADPRLRHHHAFHVLVQLVELLPADRTYRPVYQASIALTLHLDRKTVRRAMRALVKWGYVLEGDADLKGVRAMALATPVGADVGTWAPHSHARGVSAMPSVA
ncbi:MAG: hypothetical protein K2R93_12290 [Gemmatimonadaceae bacterium]|nr:hypothetical protein [Gemmatimonadaceae bacterium]